MDYSEKALALHKQTKGKFSTASKVSVVTREDLSTVYSPGVAAVSSRVAEHPEDAYVYTSKSNTVAVVSDGSAVLGLGNIGALGALPVMEGKAVLFKEFADVDAVPICLSTQDVDEIVETVQRFAVSFGGINLEDIKAPECFEVERRLKQSLDIPVFHDDQHGTAIVVAAGLLNAAKVVDKAFSSLRVVINGSGAAGVATAKLLLEMGVKDVVVCDSKGVLSSSRTGLNQSKQELVMLTNPRSVTGSLQDALVGADVFVGVSVGNLLSVADVKTMASDPVVFALANPTPEILPDEAKKAGAVVVATGRSDYPNQVNNVLVFPGMFRGLLDARATEVSSRVKVAAAQALASYVTGVSATNIIPDSLDKEVAGVVAGAVRSCF
ncbi:MAG: NAD(P)-dependent malic enzyme [Candidatus Woesearchaeota archaeon]